MPGLSENYRNENNKKKSVNKSKVIAFGIAFHTGSYDKNFELQSGPTHAIVIMLFLEQPLSRPINI